MTTKFDIIKLKTKAAIGNCEALFMLGYNYLWGIGVDADFAQAKEYWEHAANKGFEPAAEHLAMFFADNGKSMELSPDIAKGFEAFRVLSLAADKGDPTSLYMKSVGKLSSDCHEFIFRISVERMEKACEQGFIPALHALGRTYYAENRIKGKKQKGYDMILQAAEQGYIPSLQSLMGIDPKKAYPIIKRLAETNDPKGEALTLLAWYYMHGDGLEQDTSKGVCMMEEAAAKGCKDAICNLALIYEQGLYDIAPDIEKAVSYYEQGVTLGIDSCMVDLANILESSDSYPHDYKRAFELCSKVAEKGNAQACNNLATYYKRGIGVEENAEKALQLYESAAENGCIEAYQNLYRYYIDGYSVPRNYERAVEWLKKGEAAGDAMCSYKLALHYRNGDGVEQDAHKYFECLNNAVTHGIDVAVEELADCYRYGIGINPNGDSAFRLYQTAAQKSISAVGSLAQCYTYGIGTEKDDKKAVELYQIAAEQGNAQAQCDLGICYRQGEGVQQDFEKAIFWYEKAAAQGHSGAFCNLGVMYDNGIGVPVDKVKAFDYFKKSAEGGQMDGQFCCGFKYFSGQAVEQNYQEAIKWFTKAAKQGEPDSMYHLAICYNDGLGVDRNPAAAAHYLYAAADRGFRKAIDIINKYKIPRPKSRESE